MAKAARKNKFEIANVLAFEKKLVPSDGVMYGTVWDKRHSEEAPLHIVEKSVRGTISNRLSKAVRSDPLKLNAKIQNANPQTVDYCALGMNQDTLKVRFSLKVLPEWQIPSVCNNEAHYKSIQVMGRAYIQKTGCKELAHRYATNIANGRFLWRNRVGAEQIEVIVHVKQTNETITFNAYDYSVKNFDKNDEKLEKLSSYFAETLCGKRAYMFLEIEASACLGKGQEVYPSEELILNKSEEKLGKKSKVLYQVDDVAGLHSQKIGNAIRTIDTWYPDDDKESVIKTPIAIDPYGAVTTLGKGYRAPDTTKDFYTLFDAWSTTQGEQGNTEEAVDSGLTDEEENFVIAVLIRGGVFSKKKDE